MQLESYLQTPASEPMLTDPDEVQNAIRGLKVRKDPGPNGIPNRALKYLPMRAVLLLVHLFNLVLRIHHSPPVWKQARGISILKPGKYPAQLYSYRPISLLDTIGKFLRNPARQDTASSKRVWAAEGRTVWVSTRA